jgi:hypothetical protein
MSDNKHSKYGVLSRIVTAAGCIMAAAGAITLAWRGRANWEPSEQDIPAGPEKVAAVVTGVLIVILWATLSDARFLRRLAQLGIRFLIGAVASLLIYGFLVGTETYELQISPAAGEVVAEKIVGGFWLTSEASARQQEFHVTVQELLKGAGYDPDKLWSRSSRALAKTSLVVCYVGLTVCGTLALTCAAIILGLKLKKRSPQ